MKKKLLIGLALGSFLFGAQKINAEERYFLNPEPIVQSYQSQKNSGLNKEGWNSELGLEIYRFNYEEPGLMQENGNMVGLKGVFEYKKDKTMFGLEGRIASGECSYDGMLHDGTPYAIAGIGNSVKEFRVLAGKSSYNHLGNLTTLYIGIGTRNLKSDSSFDPAGYRRESNYSYIPLGIKLESQSKTGLFIEFTAEYDLFLSGKQKTYLSDFDPTFPNIENTQNKGRGFRMSVGFERKNKEGGGFKIEPYIRTWDIGDSEPTFFWVDDELYGAMEPANNTTEIGIGVSLFL